MFGSHGPLFGPDFVHVHEVHCAPVDLLHLHPFRAGVAEFAEIPGLL